MMLNLKSCLIAVGLSMCFSSSFGAEPRNPNAPEAEPGEVPPDAPVKAAVPAEVIVLPGEADAKKSSIGAKKVADKLKVDAKPAASTAPATAKPAQPLSASSTRPSTAKSGVLVPTVLPPLQSPNDRAREAGYGVVLSGVLDKNTEIGPEQSPAMIRGLLVIPEKMTLTLKPGAVVHLVADPMAKKPANPGEPDPTQSAAVWVWGSLNAAGHTGDPVELSSYDATPAPLLFYGSSSSSLEGVRVRNCAVVQNAGVVKWTNSEFLSTPHVALAGGAALFTHCSFRNCGGIFATYQAGTWSLLVRRSVFAACKEGIVLASDPGETRLVVEKNHFLNTRGAHIRAMNLAGAVLKDSDIFIGENWYGTPQSDEVDLRIADRRLDPRVKARLNIRPPAAEPYTNIGGGIALDVLGESQKEQDALAQKLLAAHAGKTTAKVAAAPAPTRQPLTPTAAPTPATETKVPAEAKTAPADKGTGAASMNRTIRRPRVTTEPAKSESTK